MATGTPATALLTSADRAFTLHPYDHDPRAEAYGDEAAAALGVDPARIFKTLIATVDGKLACAVVPVAARLDLKAFAAAVGGKRAELAEPAAAARATGYVVGGISPIGQKARLPVVVDESAQAFDDRLRVGRQARAAGRARPGRPAAAPPTASLARHRILTSSVPIRRGSSSDIGGASRVASGGGEVLLAVLALRAAAVGGASSA